jgi:hypothetical protein
MRNLSHPILYPYEGRIGPIAQVKGEHLQILLIYGVSNNLYLAGKVLTELYIASPGYPQGEQETRKSNGQDNVPNQSSVQSSHGQNS